MSQIDDPGTDPTYAWATVSDPDLLVLQLPPVPSGGPGTAHDAMRTLFSRRGFAAIRTADDLELGAANGCLLTRRGPTEAELLVTIADTVGASRIPLTDLDADWLERAVQARQAAVLLVEQAVVDGTTSRERLQRDVEAEGVLGALVACGDAGG